MAQAKPTTRMPAAVAATRSIDQGWPPPPIRSKCLERASSRYVLRRMAAALLARVLIQSAAAKTVPGLPRKRPVASPPPYPRNAVPPPVAHLGTDDPRAVLPSLGPPARGERARPGRLAALCKSSHGAARVPFHP